MSGDVGLRQRKKLQTREAIVDAALQLFDEHGFEATTIAQIADAAEIAPRTFFAYFPSKEDVVFWDIDEALDSLREHVVGRPAGETAIGALRRWILGRAELMAHPDDRTLCRHRVVTDSEALQSHESRVMERFEGVLAEGVAQDLGDAPDALRPRMVAAAAAAALRSMKVGEDEGSLMEREAEERIRDLDEGIRFLENGLRALRDR